MLPLLWLLGNPALADEPPCGAREAPPALAVVLWSRENPNPGLFGISIGSPAGDREAEMREALLDAMFGLDGLLEPGDAISVFPQGIDANSDAATAIKARRGKPADMHERLKLALPDRNDDVRAFHVTVPANEPRAAISGLIQDRVTFPMLQDCLGCTDERDRYADRNQTRDLSVAPLLTHDLLARAYVEHGFDEACKAPRDVYLAWVDADPSSGDPSDELPEITTVYGDLAASWYQGITVAYYQEPVVDRRYVKVWKMHRGAVDPDRGGGLIGLRWVDAKGPASMTVNSFFAAGFDQAETPDWTVRIPSGFSLQGGSASLSWTSDSGSTTLPLALATNGDRVALADPQAFRDALVASAARELDSDEATYDPSLQATLELLPPTYDLYGYPAVAIDELATVAPPRIRFTRVPIPPWYLGAGLLGGFAGFGLLGQQILARTRKRRLVADLVWEDVAPVDLMPLRGSEEFSRKFRLRIGDATGFRARTAALEVRVSLRAFVQPEIPLRNDDRERFQRLVGEGWLPADGGFQIRLLRPSGRVITEQPLEVHTRHAAIDFGKVRADELTVVHGIRIEIHDRAGRYADLDTTAFQAIRLKAVPGPSTPEAALEVSPQALARWMEAKLVDVTDAEWRGARVADVGWLVIGNPARAHYTPLPVTIRLGSASAVIHPEDGGPAIPATLTIRDRDNTRPLADGLVLASDERRTLIATIEFPEALRDPARTRWTVSLQVELIAVDGSPNPPVLPIQRRSFRLRTAGRPSSAVLDFGTGAMRLLLQDRDEARWGFLPLDEGSPDLGSAVHVAPDEVAFGNAAEARRTASVPGKYASSVKALLLADDPAGKAMLRPVVHALLQRTLVVAERSAEDSIGAVRGAERVYVAKVPRQQLVALIPNEAGPAYRAALRDALMSSPDWSGSVLFLCEAEAVALWYASIVFGAPPRCLPSPPARLRLLLVDVGAGTTDLALVEVDREPGADLPGAWRRQALRVIATGGGTIGGRDHDAALFDAAGQLRGHPSRFMDLDPGVRDAIRPTVQVRKHKVFENDITELPFGVERLSVPSREILNSRIWRDALDRTIREPLAVLRGRLGGEAPKADLVVLTGRGALAHGLRDAVDRAMAETGIPPERVIRAEREHLKEAPSLGARLFALGLCGDFVPAEQTFRDRLLLVMRTRRGLVKTVELLPPGRPFRGAPIVGSAVEVPAFEAARVVRTWMVPVDRARQSAWELDPRGQVAVLAGEPIDGVPGSVPAPIAVEVDLAGVRFDVGAVDDLHARIRAVIELDERVRIESV